MFWLSTYWYLLRIYCGPGTKLNALPVCASPFILNYVRETVSMLSRGCLEILSNINLQKDIQICIMLVSVNHFWRVILITLTTIWGQAIVISHDSKTSQS